MRHSLEKPDSRRDFIKKLSSGTLALSFSGLASTATAAPSLAPNADEKGTIILFQGDSITDGGRGRNQDLNHTMGHSYAYLVASRLGLDHADKNLTFYNRGISGNRIVDLYGRWQEDTLNLKPDVLSILVGVNDVGFEFYSNSGVPADKYERTYRLLLDETKAKLPGIVFVMCEPFIVPGGKPKEDWETWSAEIKKRQEVVKRLAAEYKAIFVGLQAPFNEAIKKPSAEYWIWDGIHPTPAGHELMAREWLKAVNKRVAFMK